MKIELELTEWEADTLFCAICSYRRDFCIGGEEALVKLRATVRAAIGWSASK